jgi:transcription antitermination protein NusB
MNPRARHHAREYAVQAIYQWQLSATPASDIEAQFIAEHITEETDLDYFKELIHGIPKQVTELDLLIKPYLNRSMNALDPVELAILRMGIYELSQRLDIHYRVIINEALELAKKFGSIEGYKFVNGVLDQAARTLRAGEFAAEKNE